MKTVLFDLDGTLLDTLEDLTDSVNFTLKKLNLPEKTKKEVRRAVGNGAERLFIEVLGEENKSLLSEALSIFRPYYKEHAAVKTAAFSGMNDLVKTLEEKGIQSGIVSNKPNEAVKELQKEFFPFITFAAGEKEGIPRKPSPLPLFAALKEMGADKNKCVYVGDSEVDVITARNANIPCVAVTWGFRDEEELISAGAEHLAFDTETLYQKIMELL